MEAAGAARRYELIVVLVATLIYLGCIASPPALMDDVDAVQAQIARTMLDSGDWVTAKLDGVKYLEKSPLIYWMMAASFAVFGVHDWSARIPVALSSIFLAWLVFRMGMWAFSARVGLYSGLVVGSCIGLFLFTRIQIPDVTLTATIALALWSFLRALDEEEAQPRNWAWLMCASMATGLLLKGLIALLFPLAAGFLYLIFSRQLFVKRTWQRLHPFTGTLIALAIAAPWHVLATIQNPPYFDLTFRAEPKPFSTADYRGFFWFYFMNEHVLRFLNRRWPIDYNTVPRTLFWIFHLLWLFPWSVFLGGLSGLSFKPETRAGKMRLLCLCWIGFVLVFFTLSTTQEYYSMPCYPAFALLLGCAMAEANGLSARIGRWALMALTGLAAAAIAGILIHVSGMPAAGDISHALTSNPDAYTLSLGHMEDLTLDSFAYLRLPLTIAGVAFMIGLYTAIRWRGTRLYFGLAAMMIVFFHAARIAMITFDPYLGSKPLADAIVAAPPGGLIVDDQYYAFSSVFFHTNRTALLLNGRVNNLEYGSYAPDAPEVFIDDAGFAARWAADPRYYLCVEQPRVAAIEKLVGKASMHLVKESGGKFVYSNHAN
jgi:4-amino-4-deoxy-L-arabinose transferase-like glycosyltransferase